MQVDNLVKLLNGKVEDNQIIFTSNKAEVESAEESILQKIKEWANDSN